MNTLRLLSTVMFALLFLGLTGCSKDKRLENQLTSKDGVWKIDDVHWITVDQQFNPPSQVVAEGTTVNPGIFTFHDDGSGSYEFTINGQQRTGSFTYIVKDELVSLSFVFQNTVGAFFQETIAYTGSQDAKKTLYIEGVETHQDTASQNTFTAEFNLRKRK
ncbi:MAG: hypothetical protein JKY52_00430 [Flavobacteriales bacterium]|nr:hypothetical protein [Flavobacteriales bacterium]